jgi:hypothetical protein
MIDNKNSLILLFIKQIANSLKRFLSHLQRDIFHLKGLSAPSVSIKPQPTARRAGTPASLSRGRSRSIPPRGEHSSEPQAQAQGKLLFFELSVDHLPDYVGNDNSPDYK